MRGSDWQRCNEQTPTWSPDSKWVMWQSDRSGIMNLYAASVDADGRLSPIHQVTNMVTGIATNTPTTKQITPRRFTRIISRRNIVKPK